MDYSKMSDEELIALYHDCVHKANLYDVYQKVKKVLLNSLYGAVGNNYFKYYKKNMARSITLMGQCMINKAAKATNEYLSKVLGNKTVKDRRIYSDTDSVSGDTVINLNGYENVDMKTLYDCTVGYEEEHDGKFVKKLITGYMTNTSKGPSMISYVMKHPVKKRMFRVIADDKECVMTEDHSIMIIRDGKMIECSPANLKKTDKLVIEEK